FFEAPWLGGVSRHSGLVVSGGPARPRSAFGAGLMPCLQTFGSLSLPRFDEVHLIERHLDQYFDLVVVAIDEGVDGELRRKPQIILVAPQIIVADDQPLDLA